MLALLAIHKEIENKISSQSQSSHKNTFVQINALNVIKKNSNLWKKSL